MQNHHHYLFLTKLEAHNFRPVGSTFIFSLDETASRNHVGDVTLATGTPRNGLCVCAVCVNKKSSAIYWSVPPNACHTLLWECKKIRMQMKNSSSSRIYAPSQYSVVTQMGLSCTIHYSFYRHGIREKDDHRNKPACLILRHAPEGSHSRTHLGRRIQ
jgi:hypothetical protein